MKHSDLGRWIARLRARDEALEARARAHPLDRDALDSAVGFAAEHARRYVATDGAEDGWDGPRPILVLYTKGRRSGRVRRNPLLYFEHAGMRHLIASNGGASENPLWYANLVAEPRVHIRVGAELLPARARTLGARERAALWPELVRHYPMFAEYQAQTDREIPVVALDMEP